MKQKAILEITSSKFWWIFLWWVETSKVGFVAEISALKHGPLPANTWEQMKYNFYVAFPGHLRQSSLRRRPDQPGNSEFIAFHLQQPWEVQEKQHSSYSTKNRFCSILPQDSGVESLWRLTLWSCKRWYVTLHHISWTKQAKEIRKGWPHSMIWIIWPQLSTLQVKRGINYYRRLPKAAASY